MTSPTPSTTSSDVSTSTTPGTDLVTSHGRTTIADTVVEKIAGLAARDVRGVHDLGGVASRAIGAARGNRLGLIVIGLLLLLGGAALLGAHQGVYGRSGTDDVVYPDSAATFVSDNSGWLWPVAAVVAILVGLVFLRWLLVQPRTDTLRRLRIDTDDEGDGSGRTTLAASAVTDAVEDDLEDVRGVRRASASLTGHGDAPTLWLSVSTDADADLGRLRHHIAGTSLPAVRAALEQPELPAQIVVDVSNRSGGRAVR